MTTDISKKYSVSVQKYQ